MAYYIDLTTISIDDYKTILKKAELLPSWKILGEDIDKNLETIKKQGIPNLDELLLALKNKEKLQLFSKKSGLSENYLATLNRVVKGYRPKPNRFVDFTCIDDTTKTKLGKAGFKTTLMLYDKVFTSEDRKKLSKTTGISADEILTITKLADLSRIKWVNHTFAHVLLEAGYETAEQVAKADYTEMYETIKQLNKERKFYNAHIGASDMKRCIESAQTLDMEVEY